MARYVYDPFTTKNDLWCHGLELARQFLDSNPQINTPNIEVNNNISNFGEVRGRNNIIVNVSKCRMPAKVPGFSWSFPGYKADLTPVGVLCHEIGHVAHHSLTKKYKAIASAVMRSEPRVTSYEPNHHEMIAEATKLFITNPNLLKIGRPKRFEFLTDFMGMTPVHDDAWDEVLSFAHQKLITAAKKWIAAGERTKDLDGLISF